jgi:1-acyl-sn-glycerol-3-phosphate acyltransferase
VNLIRSILFFLWLYGTMTVVAIAGLPTMLMPRRAVLAVLKLYSRLVVIGLRFIMGIKVEFRGLENIPEGPFIMAGKHQAMLDVFIPFLIFDDPVVVMKKELLWYPGLGWYSWRANMIAIDREGTSRTMKALLKAAKERVPVGKGRQLVIFPEGTRKLPGEAPDYKPAGIRALYKALDLPIVPVGTNSGLCWHARGIRRTPGTAVYDLLAPIPPGMAQKEMMATLQDVIETSSAALLAEARAARAKGA